MNAKHMATKALLGIFLVPAAGWGQPGAPQPGAPQPGAPVTAPSTVTETTASATSPSAPAQAPVSLPPTDEANQTAAVAPAAQRGAVVPRVTGSVQPEAPPSPPKTHYPLGLELSVMPVWQTSRAYDLFSNNDVATRIGLSVDLEVANLVERTPLSVELGWTAESHSDKLWNGQLDSTVSAHNLHGGFKLRHQIFSFLAPHVHLAGGASSLTASFSASSSGVQREYETQRWVAFGLLGAGVTAAIPTRAVVQPGITLEGGYLVSGSLPLRLEPKPNDQALATTGANLGTLGRSGPYIRIGVSIRY